MSTFFRISISGLCLLAFACLGASVSAQDPPGLPQQGGPPAEPDANSKTPARRPSANSKFAQMSTSVGQADPKGKFEELLENKDLSQFRGYKDEAIGAGWEIDGKYLHFDGTGGGDIITRETYDNFDLQFDWKISDGGNSGVMYRVSLGDSAPYMSGPEYQVLDDTKHADGKNELTSAGSLYALYAPENKESKPAGTWNKARIVVEGNKVTHYLNNRKVVETEINGADWTQRVGESKFKDWEKFGQNESGHIAFQDHGNEVWFRNIRIKRLEATEEEVAADDKKTTGGKTNSKFKQMMQSGPGSGPAGPPAEDVGRPGGGAPGGTAPARGGASKFSQMKAANGPGGPPAESSSGKKKDN